MTDITRLPKMAACAFKRRYYTEREAKRAVRYFRRNHKWRQEYYWCPIHQCYHLTKVRDE